MNRLAMSAMLASSLAVSACATNPYGYNDPYYGNQGQQSNTGRTATGAAAGAVAGAIAGKIIPGVNTTTGAIAGAVLGGVIASVQNGRQYYRDTRGYCYYVDQYGQPHYDYNTRC